jgi:hypothetical protein
MSENQDTFEDAAESPDEITPELTARSELNDVLEACADLDRQDILLLKSLSGLIGELRWLAAEGADGHRETAAAQHALTAICERIGRICRRDVPVDQALLG